VAPDESPTNVLGRNDDDVSDVVADQIELFGREGGLGPFPWIRVRQINLIATYRAPHSRAATGSC
jgi:hypothetical protein